MPASPGAKDEMASIQDQRLMQLAEVVAQRAVEKAFDALGMELQNREEMREWREMFKQWRERQKGQEDKSERQTAIRIGLTISLTSGVVVALVTAGITW